MSDARAASAAALAQLAAWAAQARLADMPATVVQRAALVLADDLAAMVAARDEPEVAAAHARILARDAAREATVFRGGAARTERTWAAVANGIAADWMELDEGYRPVPCHAGLYVLPALLAEAEATNLPLGEVLRCLVLGYEITTRLARAWQLKAPNIQPHGRFSAIGAAAAIALARGHDEHTLAAALGSAVTLSGLSPRTHLAEGTLSRNVWPAAGAWAGTMAVEWAECGIGGALTAFHDGYSTLLGGECDPKVLTHALGADWAVLAGYTKTYACCQHLHSAVEAALACNIDTLEAIDAIEVQSHPLALQLTDARPRTTLGAKFSMPHAIAAVLVHHSAGPEAFAASTLDDERIARMRPLVRMSAFEPLPQPPHDRPARVTVRLRDGRTLSSECLSALGSPDRPLDADAVFAKVAQLASPVYPHMAKVLRDAPHHLSQGWRDIVARFA
ncbi:MmgE/PrpD family protein [Ramlibacter sp. PS4R-6]|uniref:MmgE/PrpD family protein n=1 Tax=Ramlibacter sp. PS4R-6 TaxID=3133438 RepID=UPI00309F9901